jgi:hypothetical protein
MSRIEALEVLHHQRAYAASRRNQGTLKVGKVRRRGRAVEGHPDGAGSGDSVDEVRYTIVGGR